MPIIKDLGPNFDGWNCWITHNNVASRFNIKQLEINKIIERDERGW